MESSKGFTQNKKITTQWQLPLAFQDHKSVLMHRLIYQLSQARDSLRRVAKIRLVNTSDCGKSPSGFNLDPPRSAARHLTSRHDLNNLNPVWYIDSDPLATTDTHGSTSDTYGRWNIASQRESWQLRTTRLRHPTDGRHDDDDTERDDT